MPTSIARNLVKDIPVTAKAIKSIAKKGNTSEVFVARRLASLAGDLGLKAGAVLFYQNEAFAWQWPDTCDQKVFRTMAETLLGECMARAPNPARRRGENKDIIVASLVENPSTRARVIFVQLVAEQHGIKRLDEEIARDLEALLFADDDTHQSSLAGCFGYLKLEIAAMTLEEAVALFNCRYLDKPYHWSVAFHNSMASDIGQQYIRLRLKMLQQT